MFKDESRRTGNKKLLLTAAVAGGSYFMKRAYDIPEINRFATIMWQCYITFDEQYDAHNIGH